MYNYPHPCIIPSHPSNDLCFPVFLFPCFLLCFPVMFSLVFPVMFSLVFPVVFSCSNRRRHRRVRGGGGREISKIGPRGQIQPSGDVKIVFEIRPQQQWVHHGRGVQTWFHGNGDPSQYQGHHRPDRSLGPRRERHHLLRRVCQRR